MLRRLRPTFTTISLSTLWIAHFANAQAPAPAGTPPVRIPAMVHQWKQPGDEGKPQISIQEIGKCMGADHDLQGRVDGIRSTQARLDAEYADVKDRSARLQQASLLLSSEKEQIAQSFASFKGSFDALEQRRTEIDSLRNDPQMNAPKAKELNARIASFNADLAARGKQRESLAEAQQALEAKVAAHNAVVAETNERAVAFGVRNAAFTAESNRFNEDLARYAAQCAGPRKIKK